MREQADQQEFYGISLIELELRARERTMPTFTVKASRSSSIELVRKSPKHSILLLNSGERLHFFDSHPVAVESGGIVYFESSTPAGMKIINEIDRDAPHCRESADEFDFLVGQVLVKAGLPLTRRVPSANES